MKKIIILISSIFMFINIFNISYSQNTSTTQSKYELYKKVDHILEVFYKNLDKKYKNDTNKKILFLEKVLVRINKLKIKKWYNSKLVSLLNYIQKKIYFKLKEYKNSIDNNFANCSNMTEEDKNILNKLILWHAYDTNWNKITHFLSKEELCTQVIKLDLSHLWLKTIPHQIGYLKRLETLNLYSNKLSKLPKEIWNLSKLKYLYINSNMLVSLPPSIWKLTNLIELNASDNKLINIPDELTNLINLKFLRLNNNQINLLPYNIWKLVNLKELFLNNNSLIKLPNSITNLKNLDYLWLSENTWLLNLSSNFTFNSSTKCQSWVSYSSWELCIKWDNTTKKIEIYIKK